MIKNLSLKSSLITEYISELRNVEIQRDRQRFRKNLERLGSIFAYEISQGLNFSKKDIKTPLGIAPCSCLEEQPVLATILRAGIPFYHGMLNFFDQADSAFISSHRVYSEDHLKFKIKLESLSCPKLEDRVLILSDPMLATGSSLIDSLEEVFKIGKPKQTHIAAVIASEQGIANLKARFPDFTIWVGAVDPELNSSSYIVPGLGDVGDLAFGSKIQN